MANYYLNSDGTLSNAKKKKKAKNNYVLQNDGTLKKTVTRQDIAPVKTTVATKNNSGNGWFKKSEGKTSQAVIGTGADTILNALTGVLGMGEKFVDTLDYIGAGAYAGQQQKIKGYLTPEDLKVADKMRQESAERIKKDLYDEKEVAKKILAGSSRAGATNVLAPTRMATAEDWKRGNQAYKDTMKYLDEDMERYSVLDEKSRGVVQSAGQLGATALLSAVGVPWYLTTGVTSFGGEVENALNQGATMKEAGMSGLITAGAEILTEKLSGGISFGGKTLDDGLTNILAKNISTKGMRALSKIGMDFVGEGSEEVVSQFFSNLGSSLYKEENLGEILASEEAFDDYLTSFISGGVLGGASSGAKAVKSAVTGSDVLTGYTKNEQAVFDKVVENRIKEQEEQTGKKLTSKEKSKIYEETQTDLERGDIDIDTIESVLGGNTLNRYNALDEQETSLAKKLEELKNAPNTVGNSKEYDSIENKLKELKSKNEKAKLKEQLSKEVFDMTMNDARLQESYSQRAKRGQDYTADLSKYDSKHRVTIQQAMDSGILNNTRKTHEFVDLVAKLSAETGVSFDFLNNQKLKESGFAIEGKIINGFKNGDRIAINMESKNALNSVVGHEITHVLEGSPELYKALQNSVIGYAKQIGVYDAKYKDVVHLYRNQFQNDDLQTRKAKYDAEITADLVGEYIFSDIDFVRSLSTQNRNVFQKVYEEIKYFLKSVKAGSDAEKQLLKAKKMFEDVYRETGKETVKEDGYEDGDTEVQYSMQVEDQDTIDFLENQEHIVTYKAMQLIDGKLYPPMAAKVKGENGRYQLTNPSELGKWQQATEDPKNIKKFKNGVGYYTLNKGDGTSVDAAYNPYEHSSNLVLNDQFESAHRRENLVTVEGIIPTSEMTSGYRAEFSKDSTGVMDWHSGVVAGKLKDNKRQVYLSRYFKPVRIMDDSEVAAKYKEILDGQDVPVPFNVVSPSLLSELEKAGVDIDYDGSPMYQYYAKKSAEKNNINNEVKVMKDNTAVKYSLATWTPETKKKVKNNLVKAGHDTAQVDKWIDDVNGVASVIAANKDRLDFEAADNQTMLKNNQEYVKTLDASTLCAKRLVYQGTFDAIQHRLPNTVLTSDDLIELANMMKEHGVEAPCSVCYVESRRRHLGKFAQDWLDGYEGEYIPNLDEVTTSDGLETLRHTHPQTYKDFVDAMNKKGSSNPKVVQLRTEYRNEIMKLTPKQIEKIEAIGGLRVQSFSDFETPHLLDMMQAVMDMSAKGITSQAYTKVPNFAWVFGDTGIKINLSLIAEGDGFDSDGNLAFSSVEGMDINDAMALRDAYSDNVGTIIVGANDKHILACMQDDRIDYIIPFHRSGWGQNELKLMGLDSYKDYTYGQKEHDLETGKGLANLYPPDYWDYNLTGKENAERYLNLCARTGREPKFSEFLVNNGDGSYSLQPDGSTDGYWKTLIDFKMYNNDGKGAAQQKVQPNFNMEQAYRVLDEYEGGANKLPVSNEVVEKFVAKIQEKNLAPAPENIQYSISQDSKGRTLTKEQQEKFKYSVVRDENGYLKPLYHGSESMAFTEFNVENGVWLSETQSYAEVYSGNWHSWRDDYEDAPVRSDINGLEKEVYADEDLRIYELYADIKNPFDIGEINGTLSEGKVGDLANKLGHYIADQTGDMKQGGKVAREVRQLAKNYIGEKAYNFTRTKEFMDYAKQLGFDGFEATENGKKTYCVFNSADQVKLTTNQTPTENPDIRYSLSDRNQSIAPMRNGYYSEDVLLDKSETQLSEENSTSEVEEIAPVGNVPVIEEPREEQIPEPVAPQTPEQILYSLEESQDAKLGKMDTKVDAVEEEDTPELSVEEQYSARVENYRTAIEGYNTSRAETEKAFDDVIAQKQAEYDGLKRKDTLKASNLLMQMENLRLRKANNLSKFDTRIENTQKRLDKMIAEEDIVKERMYGKRRKEAHEGIVNNIKSYFTSKGFDLDTVLGNAKNLSTFSTVDNTPQRVMEKSLGYKEGQALADVTVNKVAQNESEGIRWVNGIVKELKQISKEYGIKPRSKESAAAQKYAEGYYVDENDRIMPYKDEQLMAEFSDPIKRQNIVMLATDPRIRKIYDDAFDLINASRRQNHYKEIPKRNNYYLHTMEKSDIFSRLGTPFNPQDIGSADLPTDINGMTADFTPGQPYFASANARKGYKTTYDLLGGVEKYVNSAKNQIFHIGDIQTLRALRNYIADMYGQAKGFEGLDELSNVEVAERIKQIQSNHLSSFAKFLNEEANIIAGKTSLIDRGLEGIIGRRGIKVVETINRQVGSNMVGFNVSSALTNVVSGVQAMAKSNKFDVLKAFTQTVSNRIGSIYGKSDGFTEENSGYIRRQGIERFSSRPVDKINDAGYLLMGAVDSVTSEFILRTKYNELTRKGMPSEQAHIEADKWAYRILGDRTVGQQPQLYNSKMLGLITKFQLEVRNQLDSQFYDTYQDAKTTSDNHLKTAAKVGKTVLELAVLQHVFGKAFESVTGYNPAFDIIETLMTIIGADDDEESEDTVLDNVEQGFLALLEDLPYTSTFTGGRIPIESALPIKELITGENEYGQEISRKDTLMEVAPYYVLPTGYGQIKKTKSGLDMFDEDLPVTGSYTDTGNLRFPVEDTLGNRVKAGVFGQYANENAREYFDRGEAPLKEKQIQEYKDLELPIRDYWDYREGLKKQKELEDKFEYINDMDVPVEKKNIMINNVVDRKEPVDMSNYDDFANYEEFDWYTKNTEKYDYFGEYGVSLTDYLNADDDTKDAIDGDYHVYKNYPEKVTLSKAISSNWIEYRGYYKDLNDIRADKDSKGETITGTGKAKKMAYIESLPLDAGQKMILHRIFYDGKKDKNTYNPQIIRYLEGRNDISHAELVTILEELDMKVYPDGTITW